MALKGQKTKSDFMEWDKMQTLILKLERDKNYKFALLISCGCYLGLRISDLRLLRWSDILNKEYYVLIEKKTKKERRVTINPELKEIVQRIYNKTLPDCEQYIFVNRFGVKPISIQHVNTKLKEILSHYGIRGQFSSHSFRKTLGRRIWSNNDFSEQSLIMLSQLFNHASVKTTKIYLGISEKEISNLYLCV
jgi:integrase